MQISGYPERIRAKWASGQATEHSYRGIPEALFQSIDPALEIINEPKRSEAGMPDFLFQRNGVPVGWVEAKDIDKYVIRLKGYSIEQRKRYEKAFPNLIYTTGVDFGIHPFPFIGDGDDIVAPGYPKFEEGRVRINSDQAFDAVPAIAWGLHIGGYQPAQKWLKDRRGCALGWDDIGHYQKIVKILAETDRVMGEIALPLEGEGTAGE